MDSPLESRPKFNLSQPIQISRKHKIDRPQISLNPHFEKSPNPRRSFGDEPQITAAILAPPPLVTNSTRRNTDFDENKDKIQQIIEPIRSTTIQPVNISSINKNGTSIDQSLKVKSTIQPVLNKVSKTTVGPTSKEEDFGDVVSSVWKKMKQIMGFSPACHNGGHKNLRGLCECAKYFEGELCEQIICVNNGTKTRIKTIPQHDVCKCPHPQFISGNHCEYVHCANGGKDLGNGTCKCIDSWYQGQFCESYASSWLAVVGVPLICLAIIVLCCIVCRLDLCPRRRSSRRGDRDRRRSYGNYQMPSRRTYANNPHRFHQPQQILSHGITEQARMMQENLLNDAAFRRNTRARSNDDPTVYRLESVPTYNPEILNNSDDYKLDVPPPTYEQAITRCPTIVPPNFGNSVLLPDYSPPRMSSSQSQSQSQTEGQTQRPIENG